MLLAPISNLNVYVSKGGLSIGKLSRFHYQVSINTVLEALGNYPELGPVVEGAATSLMCRISSPHAAVASSLGKHQAQVAV